MHKTHGRQFYPLDDAYIHAAVAKNIALHGVYGVTRYHSSFPCSSILWPFLLALTFALFGLHTWLPFAVNAVLSLLVIALASRLLLRFSPGLPKYVHALCLLLLVFGVPLIGMTFLGMEHILHIVVFLLLLEGYEAVSRPNPIKASVAIFLVASFLITSVRYEGAFAILIIGGLLAKAGKWKLAFASAFAAALPIVVFGVYSLRQGSTFLPSPLLIKTARANKFSPLTGINNLFSKHAMVSGVTLMLFLCAGMLIYLQARSPHTHRIAKRWLLIVVGVFLLHAQLAQFGGFFRYEAYLIGVSIVTLFVGLDELLNPELRPMLRREARMFAAVVLGLATVGLSARAAVVLYTLPGQAYSVYEQQYQVAKFLGEYYSGKGVALNDIGAPNYFDDIQCLDLWGLGSHEVQLLRARDAFDRDAINRLTITNGVKVAIIYRSWFHDEIPVRWVPVYDWKVTDISGHNVLGASTVTIYAVDPQEATQLTRNVEAFSSKLPSGVVSLRLTDEPKPGQPVGPF